MSRPPWYLRPTALAIIAKLVANPPERRFEADRASRNNHDGSHSYAGFDALSLRGVFERVYRSETAVWDNAKSRALLESSADEVMAALFGDPDGLDWAHRARAEHRAGIAAEIRAALAERIAA